MPTSHQHQDHIRAARLIEQKRFSEALPIMEGLEKALAMDPVFLFNHGTMHWNLGNLSLGIRSFRQSLAIDPDFVAAQINLSNALLVRGEVRESLRYLKMALRREPRNALYWSNLANLLSTMGQQHEAWNAALTAYQLAPKEFHVASALMRIASDLKLDDIEFTARLTIEANQGPFNSLPFTLLLKFFSEHSRWPDIKTLEKEFLEGLHPAAGAAPIVNVAPMNLCFASDSLDLIRRSASVIHATKKQGMRARPACRDHGGKIRIGYVSPDLREHPVAEMLMPVLRRHDRTRFHITLFSLLPISASGFIEEAAGLVDDIQDCGPLDVSEIATAIKRCEIDVLVDLAGDTQSSRAQIFELRPAAVQVLWLGCPTTTGKPWYDAFLVDRVAMSGDFRTVCTEPLIDLPVCYHPITVGRTSPAPSISREELGLPAGRFILGLLQLPLKVKPPFIDDVVEILQQAPHVSLWMRVKRPRQALVLSYFAAAGIAPERILFSTDKLPRPQYLASFSVPDLLIDTFPYGGHSTTGEALSMGCPVVTRAGVCMHTRVAASMLHQMGLDDLITDSREAYIAKVVQLCRDPDALAEVRARTHLAAAREREQACGPLTRALEQAYTDLVAAAPR